MNSHAPINSDKPSEEILLTEAGSVRFVQIPQFLSIDERDTLFENVLTHKRSFNPPGMPGQYINDATSTMLFPDFGQDPSELSLVDKISARISQKVCERLPEILKVLKLEPFSLEKLSINVMGGLNGHHGFPHMDTYSDDMKITVLYYFHKMPKAFDGGALELFESDSASKSGHKDEPIVTVEHQDNLLVAFPSDTFHGVSTVSGNATKFEDGRFVAVSFVRSP